MTYQCIDPVTGKVTVVKRPKKEWKAKRSRQLQIISCSLWKKTQKRLNDCHQAFTARRERNAGDKTRADLYPKTLFRPICGSCENPLVLGRSGKYASICCANGVTRKHGCKHPGYKSLAILENCILAHLWQHLFTEERIKQLIADANVYLAKLASEPKADTVPLEAEIAKIKRRRERLYRLYENGDTEMEGARERIRRFERRLKRKRAELAKLAAANPPVPPPITDADLEWIVPGLRTILNQDVHRAAPLLRELLGKFTIQQKKEENRKKPTWIAEFTIDQVEIVARLEDNHCPTSSTWQYLCTRGWTLPVTAAVRSEHVPRYEALAEKVVHRYARCKSLPAVASNLGIDLVLATHALEFAKNGNRPKWPSKCKSEAPARRADPPQQPKYMQYADEVTKLWDNEKWAFPLIAEKCGIGESTARRAYDYRHPDVAQNAIDRGTFCDRGSYYKMDPSVPKHVGQLLKQEPRKSQAEIANLVGCGQSTVSRIARNSGL